MSTKPMAPHFIYLHEVATYLDAGAVKVSRYQREIANIVRQRSLFGQRIAQVSGTGTRSRYFEQPPDSPNRTEHSLPLKALVSQISHDLSPIQSKDVVDAVDTLMRTNDLALWNGHDTSLASPTSPEYYGAAAQIAASGNVKTISESTPIADGLKSCVAQMVANPSQGELPTAIYANPMLLHLLDGEQGGAGSNALPTTAGQLPLIPERALIADTSTGKYTVYPAYIVTETMIEYHWLNDPNPQVFQVDVSGSLALQMVVVKFGAILVRGAAHAHCKVNILRLASH